MLLGDALPLFDPGVRWLDDRRPAVATGVPVLVHFWSTGCPLCHEGAAHIAAWRSRFGSSLTTVAIFQLRSGVAGPDGVSTVTEDVMRPQARGVVAPGEACAIDVDRRLEKRFENPFAPGYFVFDERHRLRHRQMGNDGISDVESLLERLVVQASRGGEA